MPKIAMSLLCIFWMFSNIFADDRPASFKAKLQDHIVGTINYLTNTQANCDLQLPEGKFICNKHLPGKRKVNGGWDSIITPIFMKAASSVSFLDSNMFVTAHVLYPFWFLELESTRHFDLGKLKRKAINSIEAHRRGNGYAFWPQIGPEMGQSNRIGPLNLSTSLLASQLAIADEFKKITMLSVIPGDVKWLDKFLDRNNSEIGMDALFNVPNDNDDTSLAIISNYYYYKELIEKGKDRQPQLYQSLSYAENINNYVDLHQLRDNRQINDDDSYCKKMDQKFTRSELFKNIEFMRRCSLDDPREAWRFDAYENQNSYTGAYLTWAYDENQDIYANPSRGVILTGQNSVDCVVLANALYAISLGGLKSNQSYKENYQNSCNTITNIILNKNDQLRMGYSGKKNAPPQEAVWRHCGLFYPSHMLFPYMLSRAIRDGGACQDLDDSEDQKRFNKSITLLSKELIKEQDQQNESKDKGEWFEPIDQTIALPTALGAVTLINLGEKSNIPQKELDERIRTALNKAIDHRQKEEINSLPSYWLPEGAFFGGGTLNEISLWKSAPFATAVSMEGAIKYLMDYHKVDLSNQQLPNGKKLSIQNFDLQNNLIVFNSSISSSNDQQFKKDHLNRFISDDNLIRINYQDSEQTPNRFQDEIGKPQQQKVAISGEVGGQLNGDREYGVVAIEITAGEINRQGEEEFAYYLVKLNSSVSIGVENTNYNIEARFLGISTDTNFIKDEFGIFPVAIIKENDINQFSAGLTMASIDAPIVNITTKSKLCLHAAGKLIGFISKNSPYKSSMMLSPLDLEIGLSFSANDLVNITVFAGGEIQLALDKTSLPTRTFNLYLPYHAGGKIQFNFLNDFYLHFDYKYRIDPAFHPNKHLFQVGIGKKF